MEDLLQRVNRTNFMTTFLPQPGPAACMRVWYCWLHSVLGTCYANAVADPGGFLGFSRTPLTRKLRPLHS
jgi:hypothetical protein